MATKLSTIFCCLLLAACSGGSGDGDGGILANPADFDGTWSLSIRDNDPELGNCTGTMPPEFLFFCDGFQMLVGASDDGSDVSGYAGWCGTAGDPLWLDGAIVGEELVGELHYHDLYVSFRGTSDGQSMTLNDLHIRGTGTSITCEKNGYYRGTKVR